MSESAKSIIGYILISVGIIAILGAVKAVSGALKRSQSSLLNRLPFVFLGLALIAGGLWFWIYLLRNPINELALIRRGVTAKGFIADPNDFYDYEFRLPNGQMVEGKTGVIAYYMPGSVVEVEYLPDNPAVNRIKGDGSSTVREWLWSNVGLLILFFSPGVGLIFWGVRRKLESVKGTVRRPSVAGKASVGVELERLQVFGLLTNISPVHRQVLSLSQSPGSPSP
jgi:hypothetical protein